MQYDVCTQPAGVGGGWRRFMHGGIGVEASSYREAIVKSGLCKDDSLDLYDNNGRYDGSPERPFVTPSSLIAALPYVEWIIEIDYIDRKTSDETQTCHERVFASNDVTARSIAEDQAAERVPWDELVCSTAKKVSDHAAVPH